MALTLFEHLWHKKLPNSFQDHQRPDAADPIPAPNAPVEALPLGILVDLSQISVGKETEGSSSTERECGFRNGPEVMGKHDTCPPGPLTDEKDGGRG